MVAVNKSNIYTVGAYGSSQSSGVEQVAMTENSILLIEH